MVFLFRYRNLQHHPFVGLFVCLFACLFVRLFVCLFVCLLVCLFVCLFEKVWVGTYESCSKNFISESFFLLNFRHINQKEI